MIYAQNNVGIAVMRDGQSYWINDCEEYVTLTPSRLNPIAALKMHSKSAMVARLGSGRFIFIHNGYSSNSDITADIETALGASIEDVEDFGVDILTVVAQTKRKVCIIEFDGRSYGILKNLGTAMFEVESDINLFCFGYGHGFIRTSDGLYSVGDIARHSPDGHSYYKTYQKHRMQQIKFDETDSIKEIVCGPMYALFLMIDGRVFAQGYGHSSDYDPTSDSPILQVRFNQGESICKIVTRRDFIFYISEAGVCYFTYARLRSSSCTSPCLQPQLLRGGDDCFFVEDVFVLDNYVIIQRSGSSTGNIRLLDVTGTQRRPDNYLLNCLMHGMSNFESISFFDDKPIVSVVQLQHHAIFITESGHAYQRPHGSDGDSKIQLIPCFSSGNIAVPAPTQTIRSAMSMLDHDA